MVEVIFAIIAASIASAAISFTVTMSAIFANFRDWVESKSKFFGDLTQCPYCFGHYVCLFWNILIFQSRGFNFLNIYDWFLFILVWFTMVGIMSLCHRSILVAYDPVMKIKAQKKLDKLKAEKEKERIMNQDNN